MQNKEMEVEDVESDLNAIKRLYALLQGRENTQKGGTSANLDKNSKTLLKKLLDGATEQTVKSHTKKIVEQNSFSSFQVSVQKEPLKLKLEDPQKQYSAHVTKGKEIQNSIDDSTCSNSFNCPVKDEDDYKTHEKVVARQMKKVNTIFTMRRRPISETQNLLPDFYISTKKANPKKERKPSNEKTRRPNKDALPKMGIKLDNFERSRDKAMGEMHLNPSFNRSATRNLLSGRCKPENKPAAPSGGRLQIEKNIDKSTVLEKKKKETLVFDKLDKVHQTSNAGKRSSPKKKMSPANLARVNKDIKPQQYDLSTPMKRTSNLQERRKGEMKHSSHMTRPTGRPSQRSSSPSRETSSADSYLTRTSSVTSLSSPLTSTSGCDCCDCEREEVGDRNPTPLISARRKKPMHGRGGGVDDDHFRRTNSMRPEREGRLRRLRNKLAIIFHHHHHHYHDDVKDNNAVHNNLKLSNDRRSPSFQRHPQEILPHTNKEGHRRAAGKKVDAGEGEQGYVHAMVEGLLTYVWRSRKNREKVLIEQKGPRKVANKKLGWWERLHRGGGVKLVNSKKPHLRLGSHREPHVVRTF